MRRPEQRPAPSQRAAIAVRVTMIAVLLVLAASLLAGGCTARRQPEPRPTLVTPTATPAAPSPPLPLAQLKVEIQPLWEGFAAPLYLTHAGDGTGRIFIVEQGGAIRVIRDGKVAAGAFLDVSALLTTGGERGLLGLAFAPDYETSGRIYIDYTDLQGNTMVARYTTRDPKSDTPAWQAPQTVLTVKQPFSNHNGGCLQFGPDGMLYVGMGDGGGGGDPDGNAQDDKSRLGKLLRVDVDGDTFTPEIWAKGLRNPWRYSFDESGGALWIGDVGQGEWEEIDYAPAESGGMNYGWNRWEGTHPYPAEATGGSRTGLTFPVLEYPHSQGTSVTGGYVYRGQDYPALLGTYLYADFTKGWIGGIRMTAPDGTLLPKPETLVLLETDSRPSSFGVDETGELYLVDYNGTIYAVMASAK